MRNWSIFTARFGGREIRIHLTFVVLLLFLLLVEVNRSGPRVITRVFIITGLILLSAMLHEFGHVWVSARQGFPIKGFVLLPIGGLTMGDPSAQEESARNLRKEISIALAGPLVNAVLAGVTATFLFAMGAAHTLRLTPLLTPFNLVSSFFWINACLFAVNCCLRFRWMAAGYCVRFWLGAWISAWPHAELSAWARSLPDSSCWRVPRSISRG